MPLPPPGGTADPPEGADEQAASARASAPKQTTRNRYCCIPRLSCRSPSIHTVGKITDRQGEIARIIPAQDHVKIVGDEKARPGAAVRLQQSGAHSRVG